MRRYLRPTGEWRGRVTLIAQVLLKNGVEVIAVTPPVYPAAQVQPPGTPGVARRGECEVLQGKTVIPEGGTPGSYCVGPTKLFGDGTRRNHTIITCYGNPGGQHPFDGFVAKCPSGEYCGKGTGAAANASQCFPL